MKSRIIYQVTKLVPPKCLVRSKGILNKFQNNEVINTNYNLCSVVKIPYKVSTLVLDLLYIY